MREIVQKGPPPPTITLPTAGEYPAFMFEPPRPGLPPAMRRSHFVKVGLVDSQGRMVYTQRW
jgi:hypothetical protein